MIPLNIFFSSFFFLLLRDRIGIDTVLLCPCFAKSVSRENVLLWIASGIE